MTATASDITGTLARAERDVRMTSEPSRVKHVADADPDGTRFPVWAHFVPRGYVRQAFFEIDCRHYLITCAAHHDDNDDWYPEGLVEVLSDDELETTGDIVMQWPEHLREKIVSLFMATRWEVVNDGR